MAANVRQVINEMKTVQAVSGCFTAARVLRREQIFLNTHFLPSFIGCFLTAHPEWMCVCVRVCVCESGLLLYLY